MHFAQLNTTSVPQPRRLWDYRFKMPEAKSSTFEASRIAFFNLDGVTVMMP